MSTGSLRRILAAEATQAARTAERREATIAHRHNLDHHSAAAQAGHGHRGHFRGYVFRAVRAPAPPPPRRPTTLRRRPPPPPGSGAAGMDHEEHATTPPSPGQAGFAAPEEALREPGLDLGPLMRHDDLGERDRDDRGEEARHERRRRIGAWNGPTASVPDWRSALAALGGIDARSLSVAESSPGQAVTPEERALALVNTLLALDVAAAGHRTSMPSGTSPGLLAQLTALRLTAVRAYLLHRGEPGPLATLARVKQALVEQRRAPPAPAGDPSDPAEEARQHRNALLPLLLLNADRPRTPAQTRLACDRIDLVCATSRAAPTD